MVAEFEMLIHELEAAGCDLLAAELQTRWKLARTDNERAFLLRVYGVALKEIKR